MRTTIDKAGRVVIPAALRAAAGFEPGAQLDVTLEGFAVRLERAVPGPELVERHGRLVARPTAPRDERTSLDVADLIAEDRDRWPW